VVGLEQAWERPVLGACSAGKHEKMVDGPAAANQEIDVAAEVKVDYSKEP